jgi:hypothetical protein
MADLANVMSQDGLKTTASSRNSPSTLHRFLETLRGVAPVWIALAAVTTLPYVIAAMRAPSGHEFTGVLTAYDDTFSYLAWMKQGANGCWLMCDLYTSEPQACEFFLPVWLLLGKIARATGAPLVWVFHVARLLSSLLLLIAARSVAKRVMISRRRLRFTLWLYAMSGGLGWLVYFLNNRGELLNAGLTSGSADLNLPEAIAFRSAYAQVHFTLGAALVAGAISLVFASLTGKTSRAILAGMLTSLLAVIHPYLVVVVCAIALVAMALSPLMNARNQMRGSLYVISVRAGLGFGIAILPGAAYLVYLNRSNEVLREWLRITDTLSPSPLEYVLGFGVVAPLAILGFRVLRRIRAPGGRLLLIWAVVQAALLYAPVSYQRRFVEGLQLPLCVAASVAVFWFAGKLRLAGRMRLLVLAGVIVLASLTNIGFIVGQVIARGDATGANDLRRYVPSDLAAALNWLGANAEPAETDDVIFSSYLTGNITPSITGLRVYNGHYAETIRSEEKGAQVTAFYAGRVSNESIRQLFAEHRVRYVIYGPFERAIPASFVAPAWLKLAHRINDVEVFEVTEEGRSGLP